MCPWSNWRPAPDQYCEAALCSIIQHPFDTITNLAYLIVGIAVLRICLRENRKDLLVIPISAIAVAFMSSFFHASGTWWGEVCDVESMYLLSSFWISRNVRRLGVVYFNHDCPLVQWILYGLITIGSLFFIIVNMPLGINLFIIYVVIWLSLELAIGIKVYSLIGRDATWNYYKPLLALGMIFFASYLCWWADTLKIACIPTFHYWQWHGIWHVLNSTAFLYSYRFYEQKTP